MEKTYITTPIYYVNDVPHVGHAYTSVAADSIARFYRMLGRDVALLTGTDEHGAKVAEAASAKGKSPQEYTDEISQAFRDAWAEMDVKYDYFVRTTSAGHESTVQAFLTKLWEKGDVYKAKYEGHYCVGCEKFVSEDDLVDGLCPDHRQAPIWHSEDNYFFRLSAYRDRLIEIIENTDNPNHVEVAPSSRRNEVLGKLRTGLSDISISRASLEWGVPLPFDPSQTTYVWVDALLSYVSGIGYLNDRGLFGRYWPAEIHLMAKDILWFHSVIWPAMLLAAGEPLPRKVFAHGFFSVDGQKMSKTLGNVLRPADLVQRFGVDAARYLLLSEFPFGTDGDLSMSNFVSRYNAALANDLGNLVNRVISMINRYFEGELPVPASSAPEAPEDVELREKAQALLADLERCFDSIALHEAVGAVLSLVVQANRYVEQTAPWKLAKTDRERLATVLRNLAEAIRIVAQGLSPFMPTVADRVAQMVGSQVVQGTEAREAFGWGRLSADARVAAKPEILFPKIEA